MSAVVVSSRGLTGVFAVLVALVVVTASSAAHAVAKPVPGEKAAFLAVKRAVQSGRLDRAEAVAARAEIDRAVHLVRVLPASRGLHVDVALEQVGALAGRLTAPRALAVIGQLRANDDYFATHPAPRGGTDITDSDGVVYRYFVGRCFEFHPLANFSALNAHVAAKDSARTQQLAAALTARGVYRQGGGVGWEYYFSFEGGRAPWVSGMAQAVAAQAFARAASLLPDESASLLHEAAVAYRSIPGRLLTKVAAGPWIRLYSFKSLQVLNAQLQSVLSLQSYAKNANDSGAAALAALMEQAAAATLSRFDTGYWSDYSLAGNPSPLSYHEYVLRLLRKLAPADPRFAETAKRFALYLKQPPAVKLATAPVGALRFWLSKPAWVRAASSAGGTRQVSLGAGWHTLRWSAPNRPGIYPITVTAVGPAGNRVSFESLPIVHVKTVARAPAHRRTPAGGSPSSDATPDFAVGAGIDNSTQGAQADALGLRLVRMTVSWQAGETEPSPATSDSLQSLPGSVGLVLALQVDELPTDDAGRAALAHYSAALARSAPTLRNLVLTPAPTLATASTYADALAAIRAAVRGVRADVAVGPSIDGSAPQPGKTVVALAKRLTADGAQADVAVFRPALDAAPGTWDATDLGQLESLLAKWLRAVPPVLLDAVAVPSTVPPSELGAYTGGTPPTAGAVSPALQAAAYATAVESASCSPKVIGLLFDRLLDDGSAPEPATGLYYAGGDPKPAATAVGREISAVERGAVACPGVATPATPTTLTFPSQLTGSSATAVVLGCSRDCLYLVTLDRANGRPVVARRGALRGGAPAANLELPRTKLSPGRYRVDVRLVSRVNPGAVTQRTSPWLTVG